MINIKEFKQKEANDYQKRKTLLGKFYVLFLFMAMVIAFYWYTTKNTERIEILNKDYAADSARQTVVRIDEEFENAQDQINTYTYFLGQSLKEPTVSIQMLREMEENSLFDAICFTDASGVNHASDGRTSDAAGKVLLFVMPTVRQIIFV